jgi:predicted ATPase/DNA-binding CsgD family transcriptional regulator
MSNNLPIQLTRFVGRQREIDDVKRLLADARLLTLTGPGGSGKTRLALEVARQVDLKYEDDLFWVDLASISEESLVPKAVASTLGVPEQPGRSVREALAAFLEEKQLLIILDNCEHLVAVCARLADSLLRACPELRILATSREPLALSGERIYPVPALSFPSASELAEISVLETITPDILEDLARYEAINLFLDRAAAVVAGIAITPENARSMADICFKLDGIPLAIELAAVWVNVLTVDQIATLLDDRFKLLTSDKRGEIAHRHQTLRAAIDWSYDSLSQAERLVLLRLSVFSAGCTLATAQAVCAGDGVEGEQLLPLLTSLVNKSLVAAETLRRGEARYGLLETIRQYAEEKLKASGEWSIIQDRFLKCFVQLTEETAPKLSGEFQLLWLNWLDNEYDNIRAALAWSQEGDQIEAGLRITVALYQFWRIRDYVEEGLNWSEQLLVQANDEISLIVRTNALTYSSLLAGIRGHTEEQLRYGDEAVVFGAAAGEEGKLALAWALGAQGYAVRKAGDYLAAFTLGQREIQLLRELGDLYTLGLGLSLNSIAAMSLGKYEEAQTMLDEALPLLRESGNPYRIAMALNFTGDLARCKQNYDRAESAYQESIALLREIDALRDLASALHNLGHACLHLGDFERARALFDESMTVHQDQQNRLGMAECLLGYAALAIVGNSSAAGTRILSAAVAAGGQHITSEWEATRMEYEHYLARARASLTESEFQREQVAGRRLSLEQAVDYAQKLAGKAAAAQTAREKLDALTAREAEVAALIAQGMSNGEIAQELVVSKRTVETHIANIRSKLGFTNRAQIVRWALETGLVNSTK